MTLYRAMSVDMRPKINKTIHQSYNMTHQHDRS